MLCSGFSTRLMISRSTVSGDAPGYGKLTDITGFSTSGIWLTRRFFSASRPRHMSTITIATVVTGCLMLKLERNMTRLPDDYLSLFLNDQRGLRFRSGLHFLPVLQRGIREAEHLVAFGEPAAQGERTRARIALAERQRHLLQLRTIDAPCERAIALVHDGCAGKTQCRGALSLDVTLGVEAGHVRLLLAFVERDENLDLARGHVRRGIHARDHAREFIRGESVDLEPDLLAWLHLADAVGRHQAFETQAGRIDDLDEFLAHGSGVARRHLAVADDAIERRAHFRALELLARGHDSRARGGAIALRGVAADLDVFELLRGHHARLDQRRHALVLALGLFVRLVGG